MEDIPMEDIPMEDILGDSIFLTNLYNEEESKEEFIKNNPEIEDNFNIIYPIYKGVYPTNEKDLLKSINALSFLSCIKKLTDLLVILKSRYPTSGDRISGDRTPDDHVPEDHVPEDRVPRILNPDLTNSYNDIKLENIEDGTYIKYDMLEYLIFLKSKGHYHPKSSDLYTACKFGNFRIISWLFNLIENEIYMRNLFEIVCKNGHLEIAKWLYSSGKITMIDINDTVNGLVSSYYISLVKLTRNESGDIAELYIKKPNLLVPVQITSS